MSCPPIYLYTTHLLELFIELLFHFNVCFESADHFKVNSQIFHNALGSMLGQQKWLQALNVD